MIAQTSRSATKLAEVVTSDAAAAPLALLHLALGPETTSAYWDAAVPPLEREALSQGLPLLHGRTLSVDPMRVRSVLEMLLDAAVEAGVPTTDALRHGLEARRLDPMALLLAGVREDTASLDSLAAAAEASFELLATLAALLALPPLRAAGRAAGPLLQEASWDAGYCPVCAAWPALAERRGLERRRFLRCGRCAVEWTYALQRCPYCGNRDHTKLGYLAPESQREARQAATCDTCQGYLKSVATVSALAPDEVLFQDLTTLELDLAALEHGYSRPDECAFPLDLSVVAATPEATGHHGEPEEGVTGAQSGTQPKKGWLPWRR